MKRRYVSDETYNDVMFFAKQIWKDYKIRAPNGKPIYQNFSASLDRYINHLGY